MRTAAVSAQLAARLSRKEMKDLLRFRWVTVTRLTSVKLDTQLKPAAPLPACNFC
jgi:hypothetical protein